MVVVDDSEIKEGAKCVQMVVIYWWKHELMWKKKQKKKPRPKKNVD